jgi:hypothetical protein
MEAVHPKPIEREAHEKATAQPAAVKMVSLVEIDAELTSTLPANKLLG